MYSEWAPNRGAIVPNTASPTPNRLTAGPAASTCPAKSQPSTGNRGRSRPKWARAYQGEPRRARPSTTPTAGRADPDQDLVAARFGPGHVGYRHHVRRSERAADCGLHRDSPSGYWKTSSSGTLNTRAIWNATSREGE